MIVKIHPIDRQYPTSDQDDIRQDTTPGKSANDVQEELVIVGHVALVQRRQGSLSPD